MSKNKTALILVSALYLIITLSFFFPLIGQLKSSLIGPPEDNQKFLWNIQYVKEALFNKDKSLLYTTDIFYPQGQSLLFDNVSWFNGFLSVPLQSLFSLPFVYNCLILSTFVISAVGAYLLCYYFTRNKLASFVGGYIYGFSPAHFAHSLYHLNIASMQFLPFFVLFYFKALKEKKIKDAILSAVFFALACLCSWYYLMILGVFILIESFMHIVVIKSIDYKRLIKIFLILSLAIALLSPLLIPMTANYFKNRNTLDYQVNDHNDHVIDLLGFVIPQHGLIKDVTHFDDFFNVTGTSPNPVETEGFLGYTNIFLLLYLLVTKFKKDKKIILLFFAFSLLAMGLTLHINGKSFTCIKLPYYLLYKLPAFNIPSNPGTMVIMSYLFLSILSSKALKELSSKIGKKTLILSTIIFLEFYSVASTSTPYRLPEIYNYLDKDDKGAILEMPDCYNLRASCMLYQTIHRRKITAGIVARYFLPSLMNELSLTNIVLFKDRFISDNIKYIIIHKDYIDKRKLKDTASKLNAAFKKIQEDEENIMYKVFQ